MLIRVIIIVACLALFVYTIALVSSKRLLLKYSLLWLALSLVLALCALFPGPVYLFADFFGFETPSNFLFVVAIFFLLAITLSLSIIASRQNAYIKSLVQDLALLKDKIGDGRDQ